MSIADAVRARALEARVVDLERRVAALEMRLAEPSPAAKAFVENIERAQASAKSRPLRADDAA